MVSPIKKHLDKLVPGAPAFHHQCCIILSTLRVCPVCHVFLSSGPEACSDVSLKESILSTRCYRGVALLFEEAQAVIKAFRYVQNQQAKQELPQEQTAFQ